MSLQNRQKLPGKVTISESLSTNIWQHFTEFIYKISVDLYNFRELRAILQICKK